MPTAACACAQVFAHNDPESLEAVLRKAIAEGQPRTRRPWKKVRHPAQPLPWARVGGACKLADAAWVPGARLPRCQNRRPAGPRVLTASC